MGEKVIANALFEVKADAFAYYQATFYLCIS